MAFSIQFDKRAESDLALLPKCDLVFVLQKIGKELVSNPYPRARTIKKLQGMDLDIYRLRMNAETQSYRAYYRILPGNTVYVLRIVAKKDSEKVIKQF
ncbi:MAG: hypothetical protein VKJ06_01100 [Vampirovibrionales bacterium]|nr:hypothetical protein [Vampirovibrionales bacterium]